MSAFFINSADLSDLSDSAVSSDPHMISSVSDPRVAVYASLTEAQLRNRLAPDDGIFIAESPKVIRQALEAGCEPVSFLMERKHIEGQAAELLARLFCCKTGIRGVTGDDLIAHAADCIAREREYAAANGALSSPPNVPSFTKVLYRYFSR